MIGTKLPCNGLIRSSPPSILRRTDWPHVAPYPFWFSPNIDSFYRQALAEGFARPGARHTAEGFEITSTLPVLIDADIEASADLLRPLLALYIGGMGAKRANFHFEVFARMGWEAECHRIQNLYLDGHKGDAIAAVPTRLVEDVALIGPLAKVRDEMSVWRNTCITTALVSGRPNTLRQIAEIVG